MYYTSIHRIHYYTDNTAAAAKEILMAMLCAFPQNLANGISSDSASNVQLQKKTILNSILEHDDCIMLTLPNPVSVYAGQT